ncbi:MAG TPA: preprotein translocase subunit YajC [Streptosporangiaceae bacterium]|nr:preprotein translocase subunit YajC [Streptosporangiaceae bacterium]
MGIDGAVLAASTTTKSSGSQYFFLIILVLFGVFYFVILRPQRAKQRAAMQTQNTATPGEQVRTTAGIYGTIVSADDRDVVVEVAPGVQIKMLRRAIMEVVRDDGAGPAPSAPPAPEPGGQGTPADDWDTGDRNK